MKKTRKTKNEKRGKACARGFSCFFILAIGEQLAFLFVVFRWKIKAIVLCVLGAVEGLREMRLRRSFFFFFSLLSYSLLLPLVSRRGGGGENPLDKEDYEDCDWLHATLFRETGARRGARARR